MNRPNRPPALSADIFNSARPVFWSYCFVDSLLDAHTFAAIVDLKSGEALLKPVVKLVTCFIAGRRHEIDRKGNRDIVIASFICKLIVHRDSRNLGIKSDR